MSIVKNRYQVVAAVVLLIALTAALWSVTSQEPAAAQTGAKKILIETYAVAPVNGWTDVRALRGATNPVCAGNLPQGGPGIPASVIAWSKTFTSTYTILGLRILDQHGTPMTKGVTVTCTMLIPEEVTP